MGQKIHPNGFRLGITQTHLSSWFENSKNYSKVINEDFIIRTLVKNFFNKNNLLVSDIKIKRFNRAKSVFIYVKIHSKFDEKDKTQNKITYIKKILKNLNFDPLKKKVEQILLTGSYKYFKITPKIIEEEYKDANLVGLKVGDDLCNRIPFKRSMKDALGTCYLAGVLGIKIQVSGRLNGAEIARSEWKRQGRVPLHTLRAKITYSHQLAQTIYGIIGVKVWLYFGEDQSLSKKFV